MGKKIITVLGEVNPSKMGKTSAHDHILIDLSNQFSIPEEVSRSAIVNDSLTLRNAGLIRRNPWAIRDNLIINDINLAIKEVEEFKRQGGGTIIDVTNIGLGRDPRALYYIAKATNVNIVTGAGYYYSATHPVDMDQKPVEAIFEEIVKDVTEGIGDTSIRCGVIGEIGISDIMQLNEEKVLKATSLAQKKLGVPVEVHIFPWVADGYKELFGNKVLDILEDNGADIRKICINHVDVARKINLKYIESLLKRGAYVSFDNFGHEFPIPRDSRMFVPGPFATDWERCEAIIELCSKGYGKKILVANDICHRHMLCEYGGNGYAHIITTVPDMMRDLGLAKNDIENFLIDNPAEFFAF